MATAVRRAAFAAGHWYAGFLIVASSLIALAYIGRVAEVMLLKEPADDGKFVLPKEEAPLSMLVPMWILVAANIYFGVRTDLTGDIATAATRPGSASAFTPRWRCMNDLHSGAPEPPAATPAPASS